MQVQSCRPVCLAQIVKTAQTTFAELCIWTKKRPYTDEKSVVCIHSPRHKKDRYSFASEWRQDTFDGSFSCDYFVLFNVVINRTFFCLFLHFSDKCQKNSKKHPFIIFSFNTFSHIQFLWLSVVCRFACSFFSSSFLCYCVAYTQTFRTAFSTGSRAKNFTDNLRHDVCRVLADGRNPVPEFFHMKCSLSWPKYPAAFACCAVNMVLS